MSNKITFIDATPSDMLQRPPLYPAQRTTTKPLIVTPTLLLRSDNTPEAERPHDKGSAVDHNGDEVLQPDRHPSRLAL